MTDRELTDQLRAHARLVESLADRLSRRNRDELDDLRQEGMIAVWQLIDHGQPVTEKEVEKRMRKWVRYRGRQLREVPTSYDTFLPLED
jgi:DNA-directed RNA polymerase specialized sigma24 family protein